MALDLFANSVLFFVALIWLLALLFGWTLKRIAISTLTALGALQASVLAVALIDVPDALEIWIRFLPYALVCAVGAYYRQYVSLPITLITIWFLADMAHISGHGRIPHFSDYNRAFMPFYFVIPIGIQILFVAMRKIKTDSKIKIYKFHQ